MKTSTEAMRGAQSCSGWPRACASRAGTGRPWTDGRRVSSVWRTRRSERERVALASGRSVRDAGRSPRS